MLREFDRLDAEQRERVVAGIVGQVDELTALVADVVELARGDEPEHEAEDIAFEGSSRTPSPSPAALAGRDVRRWTSTPVTVRGVAARLDRAVRNLLDNAAKFSGPGRTVEVHLSRDGALYVRDRGPGISDGRVAQRLRAVLPGR